MSRTELKKNNSNKRSRRMKKLIAIAAMAMVVGATVSRAQTTNSVTVSNGVVIVAGPISLDIKVKLNGATKLAAPTVSGVEAALVEGNFGGVSNNLSFVLGTTILDSTNVITSFSPTSGVEVVTNTVTSSISSNAWLATDSPVEFGKGKFAAAGSAVNFGVAGPFGSSNLVAFITGTVKAGKSGPVEDKGKGGSSSNSTSSVDLSAKAVGVWAEGVSTFSASISTAK
jgi:hypothetical protein